MVLKYRNLGNSGICVNIKSKNVHWNFRYSGTIWKLPEQAKFTLLIYLFTYFLAMFGLLSPLKYDLLHLKCNVTSKEALLQYKFKFTMKLLSFFSLKRKIICDNCIKLKGWSIFLRNEIHVSCFVFYWIFDDLLWQVLLIITVQSEKQL